MHITATIKQICCFLHCDASRFTRNVILLPCMQLLLQSSYCFNAVWITATTSANVYTLENPTESLFQHIHTHTSTRISIFRKLISQTKVVRRREIVCSMEKVFLVFSFYLCWCSNHTLQHNTQSNKLIQNDVNQLHFHICNHNDEHACVIYFKIRWNFSNFQSLEYFW